MIKNESGLNVFAWNAQERLGNPEYQAEFFEHLRSEVADQAGVVAISEVCREKPLPPDEAIGALQDFADDSGYSLHWTEYDDKEPRLNAVPGYEKYFAVLSRYEVISSSIARLHSNNAISLKVKNGDAQATVTGAHFEDRREFTRVAQAEAYLEMIDWGDSTPNILAGDLNTMNGSTVRARLLRVGKVLSRLSDIPPEGPMVLSESQSRSTREQLKYKLQRAYSVGRRVSEIGIGEAYDTLTEGGLVDADKEQLPTHKIGQLDHIMHTPDLVVTNFRRGGKGPSDHNLIAATFTS